MGLDAEMGLGKGSGFCASSSDGLNSAGPAVPHNGEQDRDADLERRFFDKGDDELYREIICVPSLESWIEVAARLGSPGCCAIMAKRCAEQGDDPKSAEEDLLATMMASEATAALPSFSGARGSAARWGVAAAWFDQLRQQRASDGLDSTAELGDDSEASCSRRSTSRRVHARGHMANNGDDASSSSASTFASASATASNRGSHAPSKASIRASISAHSTSVDVGPPAVDASLERKIEETEIDMALPPEEAYGYDDEDVPASCETWETVEIAARCILGRCEGSEEEGYNRAIGAMLLHCAGESAMETGKMRVGTRLLEEAECVECE
jgi:hypothetical protein